MSATTTLKFTLGSPTPTPTPTPTPGNTTTIVGSPNTGENTTSGDNVSGTVFSTLFILIGLVALGVFLAKYLKKNRHMSFADRGSFHISMRPRVFVTASLVLAVAFLGSSILARGFSQNERSADAASTELGVSVTSEMTFDAERGKSASLTDNVSVSAGGKGYTLQVSTDNSKFCLSGSTSDCLSSTSGDITSTNPSNLSSLSTNEWGMSLIGSDTTGKIWGAVPTTPKTIVNKTSTSADTDVTKVFYGVNVGDSLPDGTYYGRVIYTAYTDEVTNYKVTTFNGYVGTTGTETTSRFNDGVTVSIRQNCPSTSQFLGWSSKDINVSIITGPNSNGIYQFVMPAKDVELTALCYGDEEENPMQIVYDANAPTGTTATGTTPNTNIGANDTTVTLSTNGYSISNYSFVGWACKKTATAKDYTSGQANVSVSDIVSKCGLDTSKDIPTITLYAIWTPNITYLQDLTPAMCDIMNVLDTLALKDKRDNKDYHVRKYADGRCWMLEDMNYTPTGTVTLDPSTSDVTSSTSLTIATSGTSGARYHTQSGYSTLYNYKAATAGTWSNQSANTLLPDSICPAHYKMPDAYSRLSNQFSNVSGELWDLAKYNIGTANGGGDGKSDSWKTAFTFAANDDATYHGPHFTFNGAWDFANNKYVTKGTTSAAAGSYGSYFMNTITTHNSGTGPAAFNPHRSGVDSDTWDINSTDATEGSAVRCLLRTATQMTTRNAPGVSTGDASEK